MKFINTKTGVIIETNNELVINQYKKSDYIKEFIEKEEKPKVVVKKTTKKNK